MASIQRTIFTLLTIAGALSCLVPDARGALGENLQTANTNFWWYFGQTPDQVSTLISTNNARLVSLRVESANPLLLDVALVQNRNTYQKTWWWYVGQTEAQVNNLWQTDQARIFDVKSYVLNGSRLFAVLMLGNSWTTTQASNGECDLSIISDWHTTLPAVGLGSSSATASYDSTITTLMQKYHVPGGAVAVTENGRLVLARGYGLSDVDSPQIAHPDSLFRIASLSKQITSAAVLKLVQDGKLSLRTNVFPLLGFTPDPNGTQTSALTSITVQDLLDHTGGWSRETGCTGCGTEGDPMFESQTIQSAQSDAGPPSCGQIIQYMLTQPVKWTVGTVYDYSNFGYCTLGAVIEKVTGTNYASWVTDNVLSDAGATGIVQGQTIWPADREVVYYDYPGASAGSDVFAPSLNAFTEPYGGFYLEAMAAHGAWVSSPVDLLRFQGAIDGRTGLSPLFTAASISELTQNPNVLWAEVNGSNQLVTQSVTGTWYGLGWLINSAGNWWHTGSLPGTATEQVHASNGWGWAAFFNSRPENANGFANDLDTALWTAFNGAGSWLTANLFDQYGAYTSWMAGSNYQSFFNAQAAAGNYPSRIEGASIAGTPLYRAVFAPFHGTYWESRNGMSCPAYQSYATSFASQGYQTASLQSYVANDGTRRYQATWVKW